MMFISERGAVTVVSDICVGVLPLATLPPSLILLANFLTLTVQDSPPVRAGSSLNQKPKYRSQINPTRRIEIPVISLRKLVNHLKITLFLPLQDFIPSNF